jgi:hypothetical protein
VAEHEFTPDQIRNQAQGNVTAFILASIAYCKEQGRSPEEFITFVGKKFTPGWKAFKGESVKEVMDVVALNILSAGGKLVAVSADHALAQATFAGWPSFDDLEFFGLTQNDADVIWSIFQPIMAYLNLKYHWQREQDEVTVILSR